MDELMTGNVENTDAISLSNATLDKLPPQIMKPTYDRSKLFAGIIHIGLGNFHRAHQAWYLHQLMEQGKAQEWAIVGAGVRPQDRKMREKLLSQDCLTTLIELDPAGTSVEVTGSMIDFIPVETGHAPLIEAMANPAIKIVSLTVTEGGYYVDPATGGFDENNDDIRHDVANPLKPITAFGAMIAALKIRRDRGHGPFTGQSCDNLQGNGEILRKTIISLAKLQDPDLAQWIDSNCTFPNSMVDCIVPATGANELNLVRRLGIDDAVPVTHENFRQWVIEDNFCAGRPDWDLVGATFCQSVHDYEAMKIRILNGGHQVIANVGELMSIETISDCMAQPEIQAMFRKVQREEITPYVSLVPGMTPSDYAVLIEKRFANNAIFDTTRRVAFDGSSRHPGFILPTLRDALNAGGSFSGLSLVEALWCKMCAGVRDDGSIIEPNDPNWSDLNGTALAAQTRAIAWLEQSQYYGDLVSNPEFVQTFEKWLEIIWTKGSVEALRIYIKQG